MVPPIAVTQLSKRFGDVVAVDNLSFQLQPGRVTGLLGPNSSGKTTTLRMLVGLVTPTSGKATVRGRKYRELQEPSRVVGAALEASGFHPGRSARDHVRVVALQAGLGGERVESVLAQTGIDDDAD